MRLLYRQDLDSTVDLPSLGDIMDMPQPEGGDTLSAYKLNSKTLVVRVSKKRIRKCAFCKVTENERNLVHLKKFSLCWGCFPMCG